MASKSLTFDIFGRDRTATKAIQGVGEASEGLGGKLKKLAGVFAAAFAVGQVVEFGKKVVNAASDLQEAGTAVGEVFGPATAGIEEWARTAATAFGQSTLQALDAAKTFGIYGKAAGLSAEENAKFSKGLTVLASDLASFHNADPSEVIAAIGSGLRGEAEPLRRFGILLDDATLKAKALELGIYDGNGSLSQQQKVLAANAVIMAQAGAAAGDFARTQAGLANQQRISAANWENTAAKIGEFFLPVVTLAYKLINDHLFPALNAFIDGPGQAIGGVFEQLGPIFAQVGPQLLELAGYFSPVGIAIKALGPILPVLGDAFARIGETLGGALQQVLPVVANLFNALATILSGALAQVLPIIADVLSQLAEILAGALSSVLPVVAGIFERLAGIVERLMPVIVMIADVVGQLLVSAFAALEPILPVIYTLIDTLLAALEPLIDPILSIVEALLPFVVIIGELVGALLPPLIQLFMAFIEPLLPLIEVLVNLLAPILELVAGLLTWLADIIGAVLTPVVQWLGDVFGDVFAFFGKAIVEALKAGKPFFNWLGDAIAWVGDAFGAVGHFIGDVWDSVADGIKGAINFVIGLVNGFLGGLDDIGGWLSEVTGGTIGFSVGTIPLLASGGDITRPGWAVVGERGPELLRLPAGAQVRPLSDPDSGVKVVIVNRGGPQLLELIDARVEHADGRTEQILVGGKVPGK